MTCCFCHNRIKDKERRFSTIHRSTGIRRYVRKHWCVQCDAEKTASGELDAMLARLNERDEQITRRDELRGQ